MFSSLFVCFGKSKYNASHNSMKDKKKQTRRRRSNERPKEADTNSSIFDVAAGRGIGRASARELLTKFRLVP